MQGEQRWRFEVVSVGAGIFLHRMFRGDEYIASSVIHEGQVPETVNYLNTLEAHKALTDEVFTNDEWLDREHCFYCGVEVFETVHRQDGLHSVRRDPVPHKEWCAVARYDALQPTTSEQPAEENSDAES
jgi:hypothetical protein